MGSNTVWFRDGFRADYVIEVNRVDELTEHVLEQMSSLAERLQARPSAHVCYLSSSAD